MGSPDKVDTGSCVTIILQNIILSFQMTFLPWVFHQTYVDEIQDFTQGELSLLISLSENPNDMLLTGDTAQTINPGIAFRFKDLKSLFYYAIQSTARSSPKDKVVKVKKNVCVCTCVLKKEVKCYSFSHLS